MKNLTLLRKKFALSQQALGNKVGLARNTICQYENGGRVPDVSTLERLADFFGVTTDYLLDRQSQFENSQNEKTPLINEDEMTLIEKYRQMDDSYKSLLMQMADNMINNNNENKSFNKNRRIN